MRKPRWIIDDANLCTEPCSVGTRWIRSVAAEQKSDVVTIQLGIHDHSRESDGKLIISSASLFMLTYLRDTSYTDTY